MIAREVLVAALLVSFVLLFYVVEPAWDGAIAGWLPNVSGVLRARLAVATVSAGIVAFVGAALARGRALVWGALLSAPLCAYVALIYIVAILFARLPMPTEPAAEPGDGSLVVLSAAPLLVFGTAALGARAGVLVRERLLGGPAPKSAR